MIRTMNQNLNMFPKIKKKRNLKNLLRIRNINIILIILKSKRKKEINQKKLKKRRKILLLKKMNYQRKNILMKI